MSKCPVSNDKHVFTYIPAGGLGDYEFYQYLTCIACGEQRAVTMGGKLMFLVNGDWELIQQDTPKTLKKEVSGEIAKGAIHNPPLYTEENKGP